MNPPITGLGEDYLMSQADIAEKLFLHKNTVGAVEKKAIEKFKKKLAEKNIDIKDLLL